VPSRKIATRAPIPGGRIGNHPTSVSRGSPHRPAERSERGALRPAVSPVALSQGRIESRPRSHLRVSRWGASIHATPCPQMGCTARIGKPVNPEPEPSEKRIAGRGGRAAAGGAAPRWFPQRFGFAPFGSPSLFVTFAACFAGAGARSWVDAPDPMRFRACRVPQFTFGLVIMVMI